MSWFIGFHAWHLFLCLPSYFFSTLPRCSRLTLGLWLCGCGLSGCSWLMSAPETHPLNHHPTLYIYPSHFTTCFSYPLLWGRLLLFCSPWFYFVALDLKRCPLDTFDIVLVLIVFYSFSLPRPLKKISSNDVKCHTLGHQEKNLTFLLITSCFLFVLKAHQ